MSQPLEIRVECYAGYRGEETPRRLTMGTRRITVAVVLDRWLAPDHRYFKVVGNDGGLYIIRHTPNRELWHLTCFKAQATMATAGDKPTPAAPSSFC